MLAKTETITAVLFAAHPAGFSTTGSDLLRDSSLADSLVGVPGQHDSSPKPSALARRVSPRSDF